MCATIGARRAGRNGGSIAIGLVRELHILAFANALTYWGPYTSTIASPAKIKPKNEIIAHISILRSNSTRGRISLVKITTGGRPREVSGIPGASPARLARANSLAIRMKGMTATIHSAMPPTNEKSRAVCGHATTSNLAIGNSLGPFCYPYSMSYGYVAYIDDSGAFGLRNVMAFGPSHRSYLFLPLDTFVKAGL